MLNIPSKNPQGQHVAGSRFSRDTPSSFSGFSRNTPPPAPAPANGPKVIHIVIASAIALIVGLGIGMLVYPHIPLPGTEASLPGRTTVSESELDMALGTYTYEGKEVAVTVRETIEETMSLQDAKNSDGTYDIPSVDAVLSIARSRLLARDADKRGITASEEDALAYAQEVYGTSDTAMIAASYGMGEDQVKEMLQRAAILKKLKDEVVQNSDSQEPAAPAAPEAGKEDEPRPEYAQYVMSLVGDEWDANANTWARTDGPFHEQLQNYTISNTEATYSAAQAAYYVASAQYATLQQQVATEWTSYVNETLSRASLKLSTLVA